MPVGIAVAIAPMAALAAAGIPASAGGNAGKPGAAAAGAAPESRAATTLPSTRTAGLGIGWIAGATWTTVGPAVATGAATGIALGRAGGGGSSSFFLLQP